MPGKKTDPASLVIVGVVALVAIATVALIGNFSQVTFAEMWPVLAMGVGIVLAVFGFLDLGLGLFGLFGIWLLANLEVIPAFDKSWPFTLIWIAAVVVIGFLRARARSHGPA